MSTLKTMTKAEQKKADKAADKLRDNGKSEIEKMPRHIEVPESNGFKMDVKRKQVGSGKAFIDVYVGGPVRDTKNHKIKIEYPSIEISVPEMIQKSIKALQRFYIDYAEAQKRAMEQNPSLEEFFLA